jgi:Cd2+/Zn2+-exporting ATPase/Cu+-exporting ATPase
VLLAAERATVQLDPARVNMTMIRQAVETAGYFVPATTKTAVEQRREAVTLAQNEFTRRAVTMLAVVFSVILFVVVVGEGLGLFEAITTRVPWPIGVALVLVGGYSIFLNVIRAALRRQIIAHTLMSIGVVAALAVGEWATALVVVFFMRVGAYVENFTTERARRAIKDLTALAPQTARVERDGKEVELPIADVHVNEIVIVRPGERMPVDGVVVAGQATVNQAAITGEALPIEIGIGAKVFAASIAQLGSVRVRATHIGRDTTFGRVIQLVEEAEAQRADVQQFADQFSAYYLPIVAGIALLTFILRRDPLATAAVLVVACSCSIALATPIAMLATIGASAKRGLLIKGGKYLEALARADVVLLDKTGTLTLGQPRITDIVSLQPCEDSLQTTLPSQGYSDDELLSIAASAERYSEHPLAEALRVAARERNVQLHDPQTFEAVPGMGIRAIVNDRMIVIGNRRMLENKDLTGFGNLSGLKAQGKTLLCMSVNGELVGAFAVADTIRLEVPAAINDLRALGVRHIELLTGDHERVAAQLAQTLGIAYRANLLPEDKIARVKELQAQGHIVVMVGDGVNDAPALAQAHVGIAMGAAGTDIAIEAAHIALMREDWSLVPTVFRNARRTMNIVKMNLIFTAIYNVVGLSLAAFGFLPPIFAAAAQSLPDLGIMANSARLLRSEQ